MGNEWKPEGYTSVSVYLVADEAQRVIDFSLGQHLALWSFDGLLDPTARSCMRKCASRGYRGDDCRCGRGLSGFSGVVACVCS